MLFAIWFFFISCFICVIILNNEKLLERNELKALCGALAITSAVLLIIFLK